MIRGLSRGPVGMTLATLAGIGELAGPVGGGRLRLDNLEQMSCSDDDETYLASCSVLLRCDLCSRYASQSASFCSLLAARFSDSSAERSACLCEYV